MRGVVWTARHLVRTMILRFREGPGEQLVRHGVPVHPFDRRFGVDTSGLIFPEDLSSGSRNHLFSSEYIGVPPSLFRSLISALEIDHSRFTFLDLGSGKGRALMLASEFPFHEVIGVELSPDLHEVACRNLLQFRSSAQRCEALRSVRGDATQFPLPGGPLVLYMWNPFCEPVFLQVLENLENSLRQDPRDVYVLYADAGLDRHLERSACLSKVWSGEVEMSDDDYAVNPLHARSQLCVTYRSRLVNSQNPGP
ncbi:MAG TPA: class I SAM-dependent methyltransferase [Acidobacteriaceae bacterium]